MKETKLHTSGNNTAGRLRMQAVVQTLLRIHAGMSHQELLCMLQGADMVLVTQFLPTSVSVRTAHGLQGDSRCPAEPACTGFEPRPLGVTVMMCMAMLARMSPMTRFASDLSIRTPWRSLSAWPCFCLRLDLRPASAAVCWGSWHTLC